MALSRHPRSVDVARVNPTTSRRPGLRVASMVALSALVAGAALLRVLPAQAESAMDVRQVTTEVAAAEAVAQHPGLVLNGDAEASRVAAGSTYGATVTVRFHVHAGEAARKNIRFPRFAHPGWFARPEWAAPRNFIATTGMPIRDDGTQEGEAHLSLAARNALVHMIQLLQERGWSMEQAYVICSVAVDLRVSNIVDLPNVTVSALLPEDIFVT